ncbi:DUF4233 domain-containing protein [Corynebacterium sanguinis]|uniref:DUF4233 domain-containing protein n=1 Tax=Corynebacterium sanguinis TaxID=2594913 RepID=A0A6C1TWE4_9CORY|nr:DUF4233 domain-containing protein [Corynebacterium sanguinis]MCT1411340.1 DUF4233 domain-containing protein [Corynebacterium sanguinis]MCT1444107.1 DUF4233 domain-containing protein [Corynebacterium sanguinis]MCT1464113.1 DUF4233 domain-containing protein [Corynebacterium sanguinis]MCT1499136.1 DUF4233 domain-containing protein [Corynebacterium sanguinis]MCT1597266.1 DUF4233 domain-containing protein [Corynebacterium sanguinis]
MSSKRTSRPQTSPLGPGHAPVKDPLKGLNGVLSGTLIMEALTVFLILLVVLKVDGGAHWTTFNWVYITVIGLAHVVMAFLQRLPGALWINLALQIPLVFGFFVHWSVTAVGVMFAVVWFFIIRLRADIIARMERGFLVTQHLGTADDS